MIRRKYETFVHLILDLILKSVSFVLNPECAWNLWACLPLSLHQSPSLSLSLCLWTAVNMSFNKASYSDLDGTCLTFPYYFLPRLNSRQEEWTNCSLIVEICLQLSLPLAQHVFQNPQRLQRLESLAKPRLKRQQFQHFLVKAIWYKGLRSVEQYNSVISVTVAGYFVLHAQPPYILYIFRIYLLYVMLI